MADPVLRVTDLKKYFPVRGGFLERAKKWVKAVDQVSFEVPKGRTLGLVGESGCGKTTLGKCIARLIEPDSGSVEYNGANILELHGEALQRLRAEVQVVFQDPRSSLDPRMTVYEIVGEGLRIHIPRENQTEYEGKIKQALQAVGLSPKDIYRYPHMFSGGQQQRIGIARALVLNPSLMILDEPTSALDVSTQASLLNLLHRLRAEFELTFLFISHDMRAIRAICDEVAVMYLGKIVEQGPTERIFERPVHPYTQALLSAVPVADPTRPLANLVRLKGEVSDPSDVPPGCRYHPRCPLVQENCRVYEPPLDPAEPGHRVACPPALARLKIGHPGWAKSGNHKQPLEGVNVE